MKHKCLVTIQENEKGIAGQACNGKSFRKKSIFLFGIILFSFSQINAQTRVVKMSATKSTDYGVEYFLPKTLLQIEVNYSKTTLKAGPFAKYAEKLLGLKKESVIPEDRIFYTLGKVNINTKAIPDKNESYLVEFKSKTTSPFVYLTEDGVICTINAEYVSEKGKEKVADKQPVESTAINAQSIYTEDYIQASSVSKMAEVVAKQIYKLRESRTDLLTGEAENAPRDGEGMKIVLANLEAQEKALVELFAGTTQVELLDSEFEMEPLSDINKETLFRFSTHLGVVDADDLSGSPIYINIKKLNATEEEPLPLDPKQKAKIPLSIVYNVPSKAAIEVFFGSNSLFKNTFQIAQFGNKQVLAPSLFDDKKAPVKIYFYPETGAVKQIIQ
jgi:hypothetical protein